MPTLLRSSSAPFSTGSIIHVSIHAVKDSLRNAMRLKSSSGAAFDDRQGDTGTKEPLWLGADGRVAESVGRSVDSCNLKRQGGKLRRLSATRKCERMACKRARRASGRGDGDDKISTRMAIISDFPPVSILPQGGEEATKELWHSTTGDCMYPSIILA